MSDLMNLFTNQPNYLSLYANNLQAGNIGVSNNSLLETTGANSNPCATVGGCLLTTSPGEPPQYQMYDHKKAYFNVESLGTQNINVGTNSVLYPNPNSNLMLSNIQNFDSTAGSIVLPLSGIYRISYNLTYIPTGVTSTGGTTQVQITVGTTTTTYGTISIGPILTTPTNFSTSFLVDVLPGSLVRVIFSSTRTAGTELLGDACFNAELISKY